MRAQQLFEAIEATEADEYANQLNNFKIHKAVFY